MRVRKWQQLAVCLAAILALAACEADTSETTVTDGSETTVTTASDTTTTTTTPPPDIETVREATVQVHAEVRNADGQVVRRWWGSGSIVDPTGLILTNAHVAAPEAPGLEILYALTSPLERVNPQVLMIGTYRGENQTPDLTYQAEVVTADGWLDLAVLRIVSDADGNPVSNLNLPYLELGDSDAVQGGDQMTVVGYPSSGGALITTLPVSGAGFVPDSKIEELTGGWIKYAPPPGGGISGGVGVDADMRLVGVPTRGGEVFGHMRPINLAKDLIVDAQAGLTYVEGTGIVFGSGSQQMTLVGWDSQRPEGNCLANPRRALPSGLTHIYAAFGFSGFTAGEDFAWQWRINDRPWYKLTVDIKDGWQFGESGECFWVPGLKGDGSVLGDGTYSITLYAGETLRRITTESVIVGGDGETPPTATIELSARVVDRDSGQPIAGAVVMFLEPGTDPQAWLNAQPLDRSKIVATTGATTASGFVPFNATLQPGTTYPWVIEMPEGSTEYVKWFFFTEGYTTKDEAGSTDLTFKVHKKTP